MHPRKKKFSRGFVGTPTSLTVKVAGPALNLGGGEWRREKIGKFSYITKIASLQEKILQRICRNSYKTELFIL
ncbi:hypothetical protein A0128_11115 [Leptospira tipperaryensis]|uniref:Uncharacterized protein n=1 Tax=Leptospira tipperaryensis TaxID=2564040 RepID=A0A1D7UXS8_9LEPT|nr:hypothetical protein A0128_11115 [Leptospira tipperaryensis]